MSKRRGGPYKKRDDDFNRNITRQDHLERQLFDPRSDNPIVFNKKPLQETRRPVVSGRRLWSAKDPSAEEEEPSAHDDHVTQKQVMKAPIKKKDASIDNKKALPRSPSAVPSLAPMSEEECLKKKKLKTLIASLRSIESKLEALAEKSQALPCFQVDNGYPDDDNGKKRGEMKKQQAQLVEQDIADAEAIWKKKIELHLDLGDKYIEILECDLEYAQKKGLESLCWKRAVYSLVDQFRRSLKKSTDTMATLSHQQSKRSKKSELEAMLFEEEEEEEDEMPMIHEGGGMTFVKVEKPSVQKDQLDSVEQALALHTQLARMTLVQFLRYLDLADAFYLKLTCFFRRIEEKEEENDDNQMEQYLSQWRRTKKYRWYSCVPLRGDLARYRWAYVPENEDQDIQWKKQEAFLEAWKRYCLGVWLMPAKGNLYFNLSLILPTQAYDFHKFYLSTRSLMVRRNGFLNARESMLVLFEANRRWIQKNIMDAYNVKNNKSSRRSKLPPIKPDVAIPALLMRLHGMLFTKIGLDEFPQVKRIFFNTLFPKKTETQLMAERFAYPVSQEKPANTPVASFTSAHLFWFETIIFCLSSLYTYDYANAKLTKLIATHSTKLFYPDQFEGLMEQYKSLLDSFSDNVLFTYEIDLTCQIAVELLQRCLSPDLPSPKVPAMPGLPHPVFGYKESKAFIFEAEKQPLEKEGEEEKKEDEEAWLVYIEILLHWMVLNGVCIRLDNQPSLWELIVGNISHDLMFDKLQHLRPQEQSKISAAFWPLLVKFLNKLLSGLDAEDKYDTVNKHLMGDEVVFEENQTHSQAELLFTKSVCDILGQSPDLPEEHHLRGLGWVDEIHGRFLRLEAIKEPNPPVAHGADVVSRRKMRILEYGFTLVKHLDGILYYDPVEEVFTESKSMEEHMAALELESSSTVLEQDIDHLLKDKEEEEYTSLPSIGCTASIEEMDDDVLLSSQIELDDDQDDDDDIMTQLKKRREQLQAIVTTAEAEEQYGFRRLPGRVKEREARLNYLRECIIPGKTVLVLDTNCFIGHIDHVKKLLKSQKWSVIVPLVVVTELDGLRTNPQRLGLVAQQGIELIEDTLSSKPKQSTSLRIQTSHNNFMNDISIRSEQFVFGETDKNLDDLILSTCLWWVSQRPKERSSTTVPVCLVTGDRNLSVKARARDVEVVPVSAIIQLTPIS